MANSRTDMSIGGQNGNEQRELEQMVMNFRVYELQHLLAFANRCRSGKKPELLHRALELVRTTKSLAVQQKVRELAKRRIPDRSYAATSSTDDTNSTGVNGYVPSPPYPSATSYGSLGTSSTYAGCAPGNASNMATSQLSNASAILHSAYRQNLSLHPDVKLISLPFYDVLSEVIKPTTLVPMTTDKYQENYISCALTPEQMAQLAYNENAPLPRFELQLRFCLLNTNGEQKDDFPSGCNVRMNDKVVQLPNPIPTNKIGVEPKRPSRPVNVTPYCRLQSGLQRISITWNHDGTRHWTVSLYVVQHVTANMLLSRLQAKGERPSNVSVTMIKEKLKGDADNDIALTSLRVSLLCPLGKMRMRLPCRLRQCNHLQCFDGELFLRMNEKRPTWTCPVCDKPTPFDDIQLDGYFIDVIEKTTDDESEVELYEDGSWAPIIEKDGEDVVADRRNPPDRNGGLSSPAVDTASTNSIRAASAETTVSSSTAKQGSVENDVSVIDLTEEDSDDDRAGAGGGIDSESSSSGLGFPPAVLEWRVSGTYPRVRITHTASTRGESQSDSMSPSIIVLDSPPPPSRPNETPEDPRENGMMAREMRLPTTSWSNEASTSTSTASSAKTTPVPVPIRQKQSVASPQPGSSISPPKKRYATAGLTSTDAQLQSQSQSPVAPLATLSANDVSAALMASSFLNGSAGSTTNNQSLPTHAGGFGCGIPLLSAMSGMGFDPNDPNDAAYAAAAASFGRLLVASASNNLRMQQLQQQNAVNHAYMPGTSSANAAQSALYGLPPPPPLRFGPATTSYFMNSGAYNGQTAAYSVPADFLTTASTSAAFAAAAVANNVAANTAPNDSIWDNRWSQDFQDFLNSCLPDSSSRST